MPKLAANLSWIYQEVPFLQRFGAAAAHGFKAVEILFPYEAPAAEIAAELKKHKLTQALFNLPPGDWSKGERGVAALPGREAEFAAALDKALDYAKVLECRTLHVMSGMIAPGADTKAMHRTFVSNLKLQLDLYHLQVTEGDLQKRTERLFPITAHVQIAGNPDRNEPDIGEVNHLYLLDVLDRLGYQGYVGLEYKPKTTTGAGLGWAAKYGIKA
jgi:hydroxypyruvate isomerase